MKTAVRVALAIVPFFAIELSRDSRVGGVLQQIGGLTVPHFSEPVVLVAFGIGLLVVAQSARRGYH